MSPPPGAGEQSGPLVTVILPTHRHGSTIDLAVQSVLGQSVRSLELFVIGDGATAEVRAAVVPLLSDRRVRFLDRPKTSSRAELARHEVLARATSPYVCYLGDDDIMLPGHLAATLERLETVDFTHPLPAFIDRDGRLRAHVTDLADPRCRDWHQHPARNAVSLSGAGHRLDAYLRLPHGWREAPPGRWSDHYMWQEWFAAPDLRYATGDRLTVLKFEGSVRGDMTGEQRREEIVAWLERSRQPGFDAWLAGEAAASAWRAAIEMRLAGDSQADGFLHQHDTLVEHAARERDAMAAREAQVRAAEQAANDRAAQAMAALHAIRTSRTWRIRNRLVRLPPVRWISHAERARLR